MAIAPQRRRRQALAVAAAVLAAVGAYLFNGGSQFSGWGVAFWAAGPAALLWDFWPTDGGQKQPSQP